MNLYLTIGDCNGVGVEVLIKALKSGVHRSFRHTAQLHIVANARTFIEAAAALKYRVNEEHGNLIIEGTAYPLLACTTYAPITYGQETDEAGELAREALERAVGAWYEGSADGIVTMPISKKNIQRSGFIYPGQTEFFAARAGTEHTPLMILCHESVRVALVTIHESLRNVSALLTRDRVEKTIGMMETSLREDFSCAKVRIAVLGCNPHAGEAGTIGREEVDIITPAIESMRERGVAVEGPFPADGFFAHGAYKEYDGIVAMYHDQGLIPLKLLAQGAGVNLTAGLPLVRTSPDHGTAFAIAGKNIADARSTMQAIALAAQIVEHRHHSRS